MEVQEESVYRKKGPELVQTLGPIAYVKPPKRSNCRKTKTC